MIELTKQIRDVNDYEKFKSLVEQKYNSKVIGHHQEQGIGVLELASGDEVKYWDVKKLIGNPFGRRGKDNRIPAHFTKTKYSEFGFKTKGNDEFITNYAIKFGAGTLAYAKSLGLTPAQIRKAEASGIGNADDARLALREFAASLNKPESKSVKLAEANYYIQVSGWDTKGENQFQKVDGEPITIKGAEDADLFIHHSPEGGDWKISSGVNGMYVARGDTRKEVLADIQQKGKPKAIAKGLREYLASGQPVSPRHKVVKDITSGLAVKKEERSETSLQSIHDSRSGLSKSSDERQEHSLVVGPVDPRVRRWELDPGSMDVRGIDTPSGSSKKRTRKTKAKRVQRVDSPTSVRRLRSSV